MQQELLDEDLPASAQIFSYQFRDRLGAMHQRLSCSAHLTK
jgi:hypothetical protein